MATTSLSRAQASEAVVVPDIVQCLDIAWCPEAPRGRICNTPRDSPSYCKSKKGLNSDRGVTAITILSLIQTASKRQPARRFLCSCDACSQARATSFRNKASFSSTSALLYNELVSASVPGVKGVWCPTFGGARHFIIVAIEQMFTGHASQAGIVATECGAGAWAGRYTIVVDDDIDIYDLDDVMWAICTRSRASEMDIIKKAQTSVSDPLIRHRTDPLITSRGIIYAVKPYEWKDEFAAVCVPPKESRENTLNKWKNAFKGRLKAT